MFQTVEYMRQNSNLRQLFTSLEYYIYIRPKKKKKQFEQLFQPPKLATRVG